MFFILISSIFVACTLIPFTKMADGCKGGLGLPTLIPPAGGLTGPVIEKWYWLSFLEME